MPTNLLTATIEGEGGDLKEALNDVSTAAEGAASALEDVQDTVNKINTDMQKAATASDNLKENLNDLAESGRLASAGMSSTERTSQDLTVKASTLNVVVDELSEGMIQAAGATGMFADQEDQAEEQAQEATGAIGRLSGAISGLVGASTAGAGANQNLARSLDNVEDEANDATASLAGTASMADLLSLQSSALSINVGAFTIALRNLTTQVPILVGTLGNLTAAFLALGGAIASVGVGGFAVALGGAVGKMEQLAGEGASMEQKLQAMQAIGEEFVDMLREAIDPLVSMSGSAGVFISLLEELATSVRVFSQSVADSFENGPLRDALDTISDAWMSSIVDIGDAIEFMVARFNEAGLFETIGDGIAAFDDFIRFITDIGVQFMDILGDMSGGIKGFITNIMRVGLTVAQGLAPVLNTFFSIVSDIADALLVTNEEVEQFKDTTGNAGATAREAAKALGGFRIESIATAIELVAVIFAVNRLAGILGSVIAPLAVLSGTIANIIIKANSMSQAFLMVTGSVVQGMNAVSSGFGKLTSAIATSLPFLEDGQSNLLKLASSMDKSAGPMTQLRRGFRGLSTDSIGLRSGLDSVTFGLTEFARNSNILSDRISTLRTNLAELVAIQKTTNLENSLSMGGIPGSGPGDALESVPSSDIEVNDEKITGFDAIKTRLASFREDSVNRLQKLNSRFFGGLKDISNTFKESEGFLDSSINALKRSLVAGLSALVHVTFLPLESLALSIKSGFSLVKKSFSAGIDVIKNIDMPDPLSGVISSMTKGWDKMRRVGSNTISELGKIKDAAVNKIIGDANEAPGGFSFIIDQFRKLGGAALGPVPSLSTLKDAVLGPVPSLSTLKDAVLGPVPSLSTIEKTVDSSIEKLNLLTTSNIRTALSFSTLRDSVTSLIPSLSGVSVAGINVGSVLSTTSSEIKEFAGTQTVAAESASDLREALDETALGSMRSEEALDDVEEQLEKFSTSSGFAAITTDELSDELVEMGFSAEMAERSANDLSEDLTNYSIKATISNAATNLLSGSIGILSTAFGSLAVVLGVAVGAIASFVVVAGSVSAILMSIGSSGQTAEEFISNLRDTIMDIVDTVMPLFVSSGNMMISIFNSLMAPIDELTAGLHDIGETLGIVEGGAGSAGGAMGILESSVNAIIPITERVGKLFRDVYGQFAGFVRVGLDALDDFLAKIDAAGKIEQYVATIQRIGEEARTLVGPIMDFASVLSGVFMSVAGNAISSIMEIINAFSSALNMGGEGDGGGMFSTVLGVLEGLHTTVIDLVAPSLDLLGSIISSVGGIINTTINMTTAGFKVIAGLIGFLIDLWNTALGLFGTDVGSIFGSMVDGVMSGVSAFKSLLSSIATAIDIVTILADVIGTIAGVVFDVSKQIASFFGNILIGELESVVKDIKKLFKGIANTFSSIIDPIAKGINGLVNFVSKRVDTMAEIFFALPKTIMKAWNNNIAGEIKIPEITLGSNIEQLPEMSIGGNSLTIPEIGGGGGASTPSVPSEKVQAGSGTEEDLTEGLGFLSGVVNEGKKRAGFGGGANRVEYNEGDTVNNFQQDISANPEDKAQISRIAKDAMEEANSFSRRQQGGQ